MVVEMLEAVRMDKTQLIGEEETMEEEFLIQPTGVEVVLVILPFLEEIKKS
jgi:hypothetical protein